MSKACYAVDYSECDVRIVDCKKYGFTAISGVLSRGPRADISETQRCFACIVFEQIFGVYMPQSFPQMLGLRVGLPAWNAGVGGAGPGFFLEQPTILFWMSPGRLDRTIDLNGPLVGDSIAFTPHFVDGAMLSTIRPRADHFVACHSILDHGHGLVSRFTGKLNEFDNTVLAAGALPHKESANFYYPSPLALRAAAEVLETKCE